MNYEKAYKGALERAEGIIKYYKEHNRDEASIEDLETIFPELKESDDELTWLTKYIEEEAYSLSTDIRDDEDSIKLKKLRKSLAWLRQQGNGKSWKPTKEEMDVLYGLAYITNQYDERKEEVITRLYQDLKREFFNGSSYENMFPTNTSTEDDVRRRNTIQVLEYARSLDAYNQYGKEDIDKDIAWLEKQGEKKPADKVEPKFHKGDWIAHNTTNTTYHIDDVSDGDYCVTCSNGDKTYNSIKIVDNHAHLWTIQDAKPGDVLYSPCLKLLWIFKSRDTIYCGCNLNYNDAAFCGEGYFECPTDAIPTTTKQRDTLMKAMADAGYSFDFGKKELKNIHVIDEGKAEMDYCFTKMMNGEKVSPAWSEEDEIRLDRICKTLWKNRKGDTDEIYQQEQDVNWLKSIKDKACSKKEWSEDDERIRQCLIRDQEKALDDVRNDKYGHSEIVSDLKEMYRERIDWLKSLKQRIGG